MKTNDVPKTLREELAGVIEAEQNALADLAEEKRQEAVRLREEALSVDTVRAQKVIATIREKVLASDRANWKPLMILAESQVFVPNTYSDDDILLIDGAAKLVRDYCSDNGVKVRIVPERRDGQYSIRSASGNYILSICVR